MRQVHYRPGKGQSAFGFVVGIIFVCIGLFFVVPQIGPFGLLWTAVAAVITAVNGINAFSEKGVATGVYTIEDDEPRPARSSGNAENRLQELKNLYDRGLITREEYDQKRSEILREL